MVTDHSTIGYEFCLLDRPVIVYDAPDLIEAARINPARVRELRSAARVVGTVEELQRAARAARERPLELSAERRQLASAMFFEPGRATTRAVAVARALLDLPASPSAVPVGVTAQPPRPTGEERIYATRI
jgi:CDP-glycerol glycerophosphotransferase (TagB/SpsB family)